MDNEIRKKISLRTNIVGICVNILLFVFKFFVGTISSSISVVADSYNNLTDSLSNIISMVGVVLSNKPADKDHPFGHGRIEYIAAFVVAFLVLQVGVLSLIAAVKKIVAPDELMVSNVVLVVLVVSIFAKVLLSIFYRGVSKKIDSDIFLATANDSMSDSIITFGTLIVMVVFKYLHLNIDSIIGIAVSILIIINGIKIVKETLEPLIGEHIDASLYKEIESFVKNYDEVIDTHDLIIHNYGPNKYMCSIHVEVDKNKDLEYLHEIIDRIEKDIKDKKGLLLVIHLDPVDLNNEKVQEYKKVVDNVLKEIATNRNIKSMSFHDLRCVFGKENTNIIFDLVTPWELKDKEHDEVIEEIKNQITGRIKGTSVVMNEEKSYGEE